MGSTKSTWTPKSSKKKIVTAAANMDIIAESRVRRGLNADQDDQVTPEPKVEAKPMFKVLAENWKDDLEKSINKWYDKGYEMYGSVSMTHTGKHIIYCQIMKKVSRAGMEDRNMACYED